MGGNAGGLWGQGGGGIEGENWENYNSIINKNIFKKSKKKEN